MWIRPDFMLLTVITIIIVTGLLLIRSARKTNDSIRMPPGRFRSPAGVRRQCPDANCGCPNPAHASYCAKCGKRLTEK